MRAVWWCVYRLVYDLGPAALESLARRRDADRWRYLVIHFRFDLEELTETRRYRRARFTVELGHRDCLALALHPELVTTQSDIERSREVVVGPTLTFEGAGEFSAGEINLGRTFRFTQLHPVITASGGHHHEFSWSYQSQQGLDLFSCTRATLALLQIPRNLEEMDITFTSDVTVSRRRLGMDRSVDAPGTELRSRLLVREGVFRPA